MKKNMKDSNAQTSLLDEIIVDYFCGGGGTSWGIEMAFGKPVDYAVNHDPDAILMHKTNHPYTVHLNESVWDVDPKELCAGRKVALAWFSPDCKHFSKAKGGKPVEKSIRALAWVAVRFAAAVRPRVIMLENVEEFTTWGNLKAKRDKKTGRVLKIVMEPNEKGVYEMHHVVADPGEVVPADKQVYIPDPRRKGKVFKKFVKALEGLGYQLEWREMKACDYGAPTTRKRFFLIARCDGKSIVWPEPTHGSSPGLKPYRTAAEIIDWSLPCPSIFERERPLAEKTMLRIARGIKKFILDNPDPFFLPVDSHSFLAPTITKFQQNSIGQSMGKPLDTVMPGTARFGVVAPVLTAIGQNGFTDDRSYSPEEPVRTIVTKQEQCLIGANLIQYHSETAGDHTRGQQLKEPIMTIDSRNRYGLVSFIAKHYGGNYQGSGSEMKNPLHTITCEDHNTLVSAFISKFYKSGIGQPVDQPLHTITTSAGHFAEVRAFLLKYYGEGTGQRITDPLGTITAKDRFALVEITGELYQIADIGMRMLQPHELYAAQGFPVDYIIDRDYTGKAYPKTKQVARCGNSVSPPVVMALVQANLPELIVATAPTLKMFHQLVTA